jgi:hypothetical protein
MPRDLDAILAAAEKLISEKLINPPEDSVEAWCAQLSTCIDTVRRCYQETANLPPPGEMRDRAESYLNALLVAKKRARAFHPPAQPGRIYPWDNFLAELDREIMWVETTATCLVVPHGSQQRDTVADVAAMLARNIIGHERATLTDGGLWPELAALIFEGATGEPGHDMMKACREVDEPRKPYYLASGLTFKAPS